MYVSAKNPVLPTGRPQNDTRNTAVNSFCHCKSCAVQLQAVGVPSVGAAVKGIIDVHLLRSSTLELYMPGMRRRGADRNVHSLPVPSCPLFPAGGGFGWQEPSRTWRQIHRERTVSIPRMERCRLQSRQVTASPPCCLEHETDVTKHKTGDKLQ